MISFKMLVASMMLVVGFQSHAAYVGGSATIFFEGATASGDASLILNGDNYFTADTYVNDFSPFYSENYYSDFQPSPIAINSAYIQGESQASATASWSPTGTSATGYVNGSGNAFSSVFSELGFEVDGTGDITFSFGVTFDASISDATGSEFVLASVSADDSLGGFDVYDVYLEGFYGDDAVAQTYYFDWVLAVDGYNAGILGIESSVSIDSGVAAVPVPAAVWLFASGLIGLVGFSRRKNTSV